MQRQLFFKTWGNAELFPAAKRRGIKCLRHACPSLLCLFRREYTQGMNRLKWEPRLKRQCLRAEGEDKLKGHVLYETWRYTRNFNEKQSSFSFLCNCRCVDVLKTFRMPHRVSKMHKQGTSRVQNWIATVELYSFDARVTIYLYHPQNWVELIVFSWVFSTQHWVKKEQTQLLGYNSPYEK